MIVKLFLQLIRVTAFPRTTNRPIHPMPINTIENHRNTVRHWIPKIVLLWSICEPMVIFEWSQVLMADLFQCPKHLWALVWLRHPMDFLCLTLLGESLERVTMFLVNSRHYPTFLRCNISNKHRVLMVIPFPSHILVHIYTLIRTQVPLTKGADHLTLLVLAHTNPSHTIIVTNNRSQQMRFLLSNTYYTTVHRSQRGSGQDDTTSANSQLLMQIVIPYHALDYRPLPHTRQQTVEDPHDLITIAS